jgi:DNA replication protein DnaC
MNHVDEMDNNGVPRERPVITDSRVPEEVRELMQAQADQLFAKGKWHLAESTVRIASQIRAPRELTLAEVAAEQQARFDAKQEREASERRAADRAWRAQVPPLYADALLSDFPSVETKARDWAQTLAATHANALLIGEVGVGKTRLALAMVREFCAQQPKAAWLFTSTVELFDQLRPGDEAKRTMDHVMSVPLLVLDDLGMFKATDWTTERLYGILNHRVNYRLPTIATTNLKRELLIEATSPQIVSRLTTDAWTIRLVGHDQRRAR